MTKVLKINSSARTEGSVSRKLVEALIEKLGANDVIDRDLVRGVPFIDGEWLGANFTPAPDRNEDQIATLATSDTLIEELKAADVLVIGAPMYNFSVPAVLKAWIDQIARAGLTFKYTEKGPVGLLEGKKAFVVLATGGTPANAPYDFVTGYMKHILGFIGIQDVEFISADQLMKDADTKLEAANAQIAKAA